MKKILYILIALMVLSSVISGLMMITYPDGSTLGLSLSLLEDTPFPDYFFPGVLLIVLIGVPHILSLYYLARNHRRRYQFIIVSGAVLISWIMTQMLLIHSANWLHYYCLGSAVMEILMALQIRGKWVL